jgi:hypothetical protein
VTEGGDLDRAIRDATWESLLPRLAAYAETRLRRVGWAAGKDQQPSGASVKEVVNIAIERCLDGQRKTFTAADDLETFLRGVIRSVVSDTKKGAVRGKATPTEDAGLNTSSDEPLADEILAENGRSDILAAAAACAEGDPALETLYLTVLEGYVKRDDLAEVLGWSAAEVTAARNKLQRRLLAEWPALFSKYKQRRPS